MIAAATTFPPGRAELDRPPRVWRPLTGGGSDVLCLHEGAQEVGPRIYDRLAITLLRSPAVIRAESSRTTVAEAGTVLLVPPGRLHGLRAQAGPVNATTLLLGSSQRGPVAALTRPALVSDPELGAQLGSLLGRLRLSIGSSEGLAATRSLVERLLARAEPLASGRATGLAPVRDYLGERLGELVPTAALASLSGRTESHVIRAFHLEFGLPPHAYHLRLRLAAAAELLATGLSVSAVTYECGFADQSHLSRKFKEVYGLTPAVWAAAAAGIARNPASPRRRNPERPWRRPAIASTPSSPATRWSARRLAVGSALAV